MTPEVKRLVEAARTAQEFMRYNLYADDHWAMMQISKAISAVEALDDPKTAHEAAIARRFGEDDGGREHARSMGIDGDFGQQDIVMGR